MIRKTPSLDRGELALARRLRDDADSHQTDRAGGAPRRGCRAEELAMVHGYSCGLAVVVLPEAAQMLLAAYPAAAVAGGSVGAGKQEHVPFALMIPLGVKMFYVFFERSPQ